MIDRTEIDARMGRMGAALLAPHVTVTVVEGTWHDEIAALPKRELVRRLTQALELNYACLRNSEDMVYLDHILNGRWFAVPKRYGGERA